METDDGEVIPATRQKAIPPDAGDDIRFSSREVEGMVFRFLLNAWRDGHGFRRMVRRAERRFGISYLEACAVMKGVVSRSAP